MATLTVSIDPAILAAARVEAERRHVSLDQLVADCIATVAHPGPTEEDKRQLLELMYQGPLGHIDRPLTREEIYDERTWPRS